MQLILGSEKFQEIVNEAVRHQLDAMSAAPAAPRFYSEAETLQILKVSRPTLCKYRKLGIVKASMVGRRLLFRQEDIEAAVTAIGEHKYRHAV